MLWRVPTTQVHEREADTEPRRASALWERTALVLGSVGVVVALWFTIGPWSVTVGGMSYGCGSPFMGRYRSVADPAATASAACHLQADGRLHIAVAAWISGLVLVTVGVALSTRRRRRRDTSLRLA
jgi:hypothetical protein